MSTSDPNATFAGFDESGGAEAPLATTSERFVVGDEVARGGLGRVHRAHDQLLDREVAVKMLLRDSGSADARFRRETLLTARLQHPNIIPVYDGGEDQEGVPFLAMRLVHGSSLDQRIADARTLPDRLALLTHVVDACNAVAYAHSQRVTHRDLKPDNILVGDFGETVVIDWGLAKDLDTQEDLTDLGDGFVVSHSNSLTRVGSVVGTPAYMPPEQAAGQEVDERADIYALGAVLYHLATGRRPYEGCDDALAAVVAGAPTPVRQLVPPLAPDLASIIAAAMARHADDRYASASALATDLERYRQGLTVSVHAYTAAERAARFVRAHPLPLALGTVLVVGGLLALVGFSRATAEISEQRSHTEAARADVAALQAERLEDLTIEQARLTMTSDPGHSLQLLASIHDEERFDGRVRTIATAAWSTRPPTVLGGPAGRVPSAIAWHRTGPVVGWDHDLVFYDDALAEARTIPLGGAAVDLASLDDGVLACTGAGVMWIPDDGRPRDVAQGPCVQLRPIGDEWVTIHADGQTIHHREGGRTTSVSTPLEQPVQVGGTPGHLFAYGKPTDLVQWSGTEWDQVHQQVVYGIAGAPHRSDVLVLGFGASALLHLSWTDTGALTMSSVPIPTQWLEHATWIDDHRVMVSGSDESVTVVDIDTDAVLDTFTVQGRPTTMARRNGKRVAVGTDAGLVTVVDVDAGDQVHLASDGEPVLGLAWSPSTDRLLAATLAGVRVYTLKHRDGAFVVRHDGPLNGLAARSDGPPLAFGASGLLRPVGDRRHELLYAGHIAEATTCGDETWYRAPTGLRSWPSNHRRLTQGAQLLACSPEGLLAVTGDETGTVLLLDPQSGEQRHAFHLPGGLFPNDLQHDPKGRLLVATIAGQWRLDGERFEQIMAIPNPRAVSSWNDRMVVGTQDGTLWVEGEGAPVGHVGHGITDMTPAGERLVVADQAGGLYVFDHVGAPPRPLRGHDQYIHALAAHPDGRWVASSGWDRTVWLWDLAVDPPVGRPLTGHRAAVTDLLWSADGGILYSADLAGSVRRWTDPLSTDPAGLRAQIQAMADATQAGQPLPTVAELAALAEPSSD